jgi:ABC-type lipoprotein export system ATPase subunit
LLLELLDVTKTYASPDDSEDLAVLRGISLSVDKRESVAILGPSGSGKTTLLNIIGALDHPSGGRVLLDGEDLAALSERELARIRNSRIGFVFQLHHLLPQCTLLENVLLPTLPYGKRPDRIRLVERARMLLDRVGLKGLENHRPGQISVGQRQRAAVVRALINDPVLLLADEPTGSLDADTASELADLLIELNSEGGTTLVVVTHDPTLAERMKRIYTLRNGKLTETVTGL